MSVLRSCADFAVPVYQVKRVISRRVGYAQIPRYPAYKAFPSSNFYLFHMELNYTYVLDLLISAL